MTIARAQLRSFVERIERLEDERAELGNDVREVYAEAKSAGFDVKALRAVVRLRRQDSEERKEHEALVELYMHALGMLAGTPLGDAAIARDLEVEISSDLSDPPFQVPADKTAVT